MGLFPSCSGETLSAALVLLILSSTALCDCPSPDLPPHSTVAEGDRAETYSAGTVLRLQCIPGYEYILGKKPSITCLDSDKWLNLSELCQGKRCPIPSIENGRITSSNELRLGDEVTLACDYGFRMIGGFTRLCVLKSGRVDWNSDLPLCQRIPCARPPLISNGRYDANPSDEYDAGSIVIYRCDADYSLIGNSTITCTVAANGVDGIWNSPAPECKKVSCRRPSIPNGRVENVFQASYTYGSGISFRCSSDYTLVGAASVKCGADSEWDPPVPSCVKQGPTPSTPSVTTPKAESGSSRTIGIAIGAVIAAIVVAALIFVAVKKGKANARPGSSDSYHVVSKKEMALEEKQTKD